MRIGLAVASVALVVLSACGGSGSEGAPSEAKSFDVSGTVSLLAPDDIVGGDGGSCRGVGAHGDLKPGAAVTVYDPAGKRVGLGALDTGTGGDGYCDFPFRVAGVKDDAGVYSVEIVNRGQDSFDRADADNVKVTIN